MDNHPQELAIDGIKYRRTDAIERTGTRVVLVVDRGWIFAGDLTEKDGRIRLTRALHVFSWNTGGLPLVASDPKKAQADLRPISDVDVPCDAEVFRIPVGDKWGL